MSALDPAFMSFLDVWSMDAQSLEIEIQANETPAHSEFTLETAQLLTQVLKERRNDYKTTIAEDVALLRDNALPKRRRMAIKVRLGEKEIIATAVNSMQIYVANEVSDEAATNGCQLSQRDAKGKTDNSKKIKI